LNILYKSDILISMNNKRYTTPDKDKARLALSVRMTANVPHKPTQTIQPKKGKKLKNILARELKNLKEF
jgi:phage antirepressor YoqD-like protein